MVQAGSARGWIAQLVGMPPTDVMEEALAWPLRHIP